MKSSVCITLFAVLNIQQDSIILKTCAMQRKTPEELEVLKYANAIGSAAHVEVRKASEQVEQQVAAGHPI